MRNIQVAIDGPAGSGKSTISKKVAEKLGFTHIDTGAMFRAITLFALQNKIDLEDETQYSFLDSISISYQNNIIYLNGTDVSREIRTDEVTRNVSTVSKMKVVRDKMAILERKAASVGYIVMDGRDIGSVVLPNADVKFFLTASKEERAKRRLLELQIKGRNDLTFEQVLNDIIARDYKDSTREIAPLKQADDAILVDTTNLTIDEVCNQINKIVLDKVGKIMNEDAKEILSMDDVDFGKKPRKGQIVTGTVVKIEDGEVYLDLQAFTEGKIYLDHYTLDKNVTSFKGLVNLGDQMTVEITKVEEGDLSASILCSRLKLIKEEKFKDIENLVESKEKIEVKVEKETDKGYFVSYAGFRFFMPKSQSPKECKVGDVLKVEVLQVEPSRKSAVVSARVVLEEEREANKEQELANIKEGDVLKGKVVKILPFACFVQFNYNQGMLRLPEISHNYIEKIEDELKLNDEVEVKVLSVKNGKITLSRKALLKTPFELFAESHSKGDKISGKVVNKLPYGLLLEVAPNVRGLLHQNEYSWNPNDNFNNCVNIGDEVEVAINDINVEKERVSLSRKALIDNPWSRVDAKVGDVVECEVTAVDAKGMMVSTLGVDGFIPAAACLSQEQNGKPDDFYAVGDKVNAVITELKPREWSLRLSIRKVLEREERKQYEKYMNEEESSEGNATLGDMFKDILKK